MDRYSMASSANRYTMEKISIGQLEKDVPYIVMKMMTQKHPEFNNGIKIIIRDSKKVQKFSYLPPRFARKFTAEHIDGFNDDIKHHRPPFIVFRGLMGKTFDIDILPFDMDLAKMAVKGVQYMRPSPTEGAEQDEQVTDNMDWLDKSFE